VRVVLGSAGISGSAGHAADFGLLVGSNYRQESVKVEVVQRYYTADGEVADRVQAGQPVDTAADQPEADLDSVEVADHTCALGVGWSKLGHSEDAVDSSGMPEEQEE
jgi:hypothetical protein